MWTRILDTPYFLSFTNKMEIYVTDFVTIWISYLSEKSFLACLKDSNCALRLRDDIFISKGVELLSNCEKLNKALMNLRDEGKLDMHLTMSFGYSFHLKTTLVEGSKELFFYKVTQNLLKSVDNLLSSERELKRLLVKKDLEIEEYKCEGGEIALRHLKTIPFDEAAHTASHKVYEDHFGPSDVPNHLLVKTTPCDREGRPLCVTEIAVKEELVSNAHGIKTEPDSTSVKNESLTELPDIKTEIKSELLDTRTESSDNLTLNESDTNLTSFIHIKNETVKTESNSSLVSPRKKRKINLNI